MCCNGDGWISIQNDDVGPVRNATFRSKKITSGGNNEIKMFPAFPK